MGNCFSGDNPNDIAPEPTPCPVPLKVPATSREVPCAGQEPDDSAAVPLRSFSHKELSVATRRFASSLVLGEGGFGMVYQGRVDVAGDVAIKTMNPDGYQGLEEFVNEVQLLRRLRHPNLVRLVGYCAEGQHAALVYPLYPRGSLDKALFDEAAQPSLPWKARIKIAHGIAKGLLYLHRSNVIHRDLKPSNVLLEDDLTPALADFGMARDGPSGRDSHVSTRIMGTLGYLDPKYMETSRLTLQSDVYSMGVLLLELMAGKRTVKESLTKWVRDWTRDMDQAELKVRVDPRLGDEFSLEAARWMAILAKHCTASNPLHRPNMEKLVEKLAVIARK